MVAVSFLLLPTAGALLIRRKICGVLTQTQPDDDGLYCILLFCMPNLTYISRDRIQRANTSDMTSETGDDDNEDVLGFNVHLKAG